MSTPQHAAPATPILGRFLAVVRKREPKTVIDGAEYVAMLWRMVRALEVRAVDDPELLPQVIAIAQRLSEIVNVAIAGNAERYALDARLGASAAECARILGVSKQAAGKRAERGREVMSRRIEAAGAVPINVKTNRPTYSSEARREREAIEAAGEHAAVSLADYRARRAS